MATVLTHDNYETIVSGLTTELNSLANAGYSAASSAIGADGTGGPLYCDAELVLGSLAPTGYQLAQLFFVVSADGTNYEDAPSATNPGSGMLVGTFVGSDASAAKRVVIRDIPYPVGLFKVLLKNTSGVAFAASGNTLKLRPHNILST